MGFEHVVAAIDTVFWTVRLNSGLLWIAVSPLFKCNALNSTQQAEDGTHLNLALIPQCYKLQPTVRDCGFANSEMSCSYFLSCCMCLKLTSAFPWNPLQFTCSAALIFSLNTFSLLACSLSGSSVCRHSRLGFCISFFPLNWSTALHTTATNNKYCTSAWLNKAPELFSQASAMKQGLVLLKTVITDQQHVPPADGHSSCSCTQMPSLPQTIVQFSVFAALSPRPWLCWCPRQHSHSVLNADQTWVCLECAHLYPTFLLQLGYLCGSSAVCCYSLC